MWALAGELEKWREQPQLNSCRLLAPQLKTVVVRVPSPAWRPAERAESVPDAVKLCNAGAMFVLIAHRVNWLELRFHECDRAQRSGSGAPTN